MKGRFLLLSLILTCILMAFLCISEAQKTEQYSDETTFHHLLQRVQEWRVSVKESQESAELKLSSAIILAGVFCFIAASISSAGGIGGGGLFIPIMTIVAGLDLKTASSFSAFMVTGGSIANVSYNLLGKALIDYDLALLLEPFMLLGVSVGVICNRVLPEWLITVLFAVFLAWSSLKTCKNGVKYWKIESEVARKTVSEEVENGLVRGETSGETKGVKEPLLVKKGDNRKAKLPWMKLGVLLAVWFSFFIIYLLRGNKDGKGIISIKPCGVEYWILLSLQIPLALIFTKWIINREDSIQEKRADHLQNKEEVMSIRRSKKYMFPVMAFLAGMLGGVFGIGGGMLISPLLLQVGIPPEVTAATTSFMVFFSSTMSAIQYLLLGMDHTDAAFYFSIICLIGSLIGLILVQKAIVQCGRASLIVFSVGTVMALSTVLMTSFGALDVWNDFVSGKYMGFKMPC